MEKASSASHWRENSTRAPPFLLGDMISAVIAVLGQDPIEPVVRVVTVVGLALPRYFQRSTTAAGLLLLLLLLESLLQVHLPYALLLLGQVLRNLLPKLVPLGLDVDAL